MAEEEKEEGFGDFTFAPSKFNAALDSGDDDDDDWGDFLTNSGGLTHTHSFPVTSSIPAYDSSFGFTSSDQKRNLDSGSDPGSAPGRIGGDSAQWEKPSGAIPLSIFGIDEEEEEEEEEEGLSVADPTFRDQGGRFLSNGSKVGSKLSDLVAGLYNQGQPGNGSVLASSSGWKVSSFGAVEVNDGNNGGLGMSGVGLLRDPLDLNANGVSSEGKSGVSVLKDVNLIKNGISSSVVDGNGGFDDGGHNENDDDEEEEDDGWEFKIADVKTASKEVPEANQIEAGSDVSNFDSSRNSSNLDFTFWNAEANGVTSTVSWFSGDAANDNEKVGGNHLWEFKKSDSSAKLGNQNAQVDLIKKANGPTFGLNGSNSSLKMFDVVGDGTDSIPNVVNLDSKELRLEFIGKNEDLVAHDEWNFKAAGLNVGNSNRKVDEKDMPAKSVDSISSSIGHNSSGQDDLFASGNISSDQEDLFASFQGPSPKPDVMGLEFTFNPSPVIQNNNISDAIFHEENADTWNNLHASSTGGNMNSFESSWAFMDASLETGSKAKEDSKSAQASPTMEPFSFHDENQAMEVKLDNHKGAFPLSFFGEEEDDPDDPMITEDISSNKPTSNSKDGLKNSSNISIKDLISSLYSEVEHNASTNHVKDDYTDHAFNPSESGLCPSSSMVDLDVHNGDDNIGDDTWEFQDASLGNTVEDHDPVCAKYSTEVEFEDCLDFFSKLKDELYLAAQCHLENLKKARSATPLTIDDDKLQALDKEIQDLENEIHEDGITSTTETPREKHFYKFVKMLHEPKFSEYESEYELSKKLSMVENDLRSANELLKFVKSIVRILKLVPKKDQLCFVSTWSKMLTTCAQELRHGALIWNQLLERNLHHKMLSEPRGKEYVHSLGEIYRIVEILGSSARLYRPWILASSTESANLFAVLSGCVSLWSSSGLEEALQSISDSADFESGSYKTLLESIKCIRDMDAITLYNYVFSREEPTCQLSLIAAGAVPGMKTVIWNGKCYLLTLANIWANLIDCNPPNLPSVCVR